ncbi:hypothetical protein KJ652_01515 [Patescibacteria group bacterium]|nr:hypothetical protein [Patescibacteria group bacterium]MBU1123247.1 hypothetical protein [Patescibacteria group bacterium]MBU1911614.1 hypothetical protein [Patescibacteria group bacterium]
MGILDKWLDGRFEKKYANIPVLLHGTNMEYLETRIQVANCYSHEDRNGISIPIYLTHHTSSAIDYAFRRSLGRNGTPVVLLILIDMIRGKLKREGFHPIVDNLLSNDFIVHRINTSSIEDEISKLRYAMKTFLQLE